MKLKMKEVKPGETFRYRNEEYIKPTYVNVFNRQPTEIKLVLRGKSIDFFNEDIEVEVDRLYFVDLEYNKLYKNDLGKECMKIRYKDSDLLIIDGYEIWEPSGDVLKSEKYYFTEV